VRILIPAGSLASLGGIERFELEIGRRLAQRGHSMDVTYLAGGDLEEAWQELASAMTPVKGYCLYRRHRAAALGSMMESLRLACRLRPDLVYVHHSSYLPFGSWVATLTGAGLVGHLHLPVEGDPGRQLRRALRRADALLAVSEHTRRAWLDQGARPERTETVLNGVDLDWFRPASDEQRRGARDRWGISMDAAVVAYVGRLDPSKGIEVAVEAVRSLSRTGQEVHLVVAGAASATRLGSEMAALSYENQLRRSAGGIKVSWLGRLPDPRVCYALADVVVVPSLWEEPFALVAAEAMASGLPVVASRVGGIPEVLSGQFSHLLVHPGEPGALAAKVVTVMGWRRSDPDLGPRCRTYASVRFDLARVADTVEQVLSRVQGPGRRPNQAIVAPPGLAVRQ
jgi:glycosyltransferase involved in cell wall biosynthesis